MAQHQQHVQDTVTQESREFESAHQAMAETVAHVQANWLGEKRLQIKQRILAEGRPDGGLVENFVEVFLVQEPLALALNTGHRFAQ